MQSWIQRFGKNCAVKLVKGFREGLVEVTTLRKFNNISTVSKEFGVEGSEANIGVCVLA